MTDMLRVLIVEDLPTDAGLEKREVRNVLPDSEFQCVETREDFLAALESFKPDFILSDYKLPCFDGMSALNLAQERVPETPFILITGSMNEETAVECMKAGAWDYIIKEHIKRLGSAVLSCLEQKRLKTERKLAEELILNAKKEWERTFDAIKDPIMILDTRYRVLRANKALAENLGVPIREVKGLTCFEHVHGTTEPPEFCPHTLLLSDGKARSVEMYEPLLGGYYNISVSPLYDPDGKLYGSVHIAHDITGRKQSEEDMKRLSDKIRLLLNSAGEGIYGVDMDGTVTFINPAAVRMLGYEVGELIGRRSHEVWHHHNPDGTVLSVEQCGLGKVLKDGIASVAENAVFWKKDGTKLPVEYTSTPMFESDNLVGAVVTFKDMTRQLLEEQERQKLEEQLRHAQKMEAVGTLAGGVAHDFNNILSVIIGYGAMLMDSLGDRVSIEQLNEMLAAAERGANLTKRLLAFSRKQVMEVKPVNVNEIVVDIWKMFSRIIREDIDSAMNITSSKMIVMADAGQMEQVLMNLVSNALYAMPNGGSLTISTGIREMDEESVSSYGSGKAGTYASISVADTGSGMDEETQKRIFEPFFTTKSVGDGTGLGLSIVYGIIRQHNGYVDVYSEPGKGTEFKIYLPLIEEETIKELKVEAVAPVKGGAETILFAEDDAPLRNLSRTILESLGYAVIAAEDGEDAITKYKENRGKIQLLILDVIMPKKNGKQAYSEIKRISPEIKALFVSGYTMEILHRKELLDESMDYILKPVSPSDLAKKVREVLDE